MCSLRSMKARMKGHVLKPETTKRNYQNEATETKQRKRGSDQNKNGGILSHLGTHMGLLKTITGHC